MSLRVTSEPGFFQSCCPSWFAKVPKQDAHNPKINGDWRTVTVLKRDSSGEFVKTYFGNPMKFQYTQEVSTGDLYGVPRKNIPPDKPFVVGVKGLAMFCATPIYMLGMMAANLIKMSADITSIFWRVIPKIISDLWTKGIIAALGNTIMAIVIEIPTEVLKDIWRICRSPIYAVGMMFAATYMVTALFEPTAAFEARKWLGKIENEWHEGVSYKTDFRRSPNKFISDILSGKIMFLGYCMQKRGNIADKVAGKDKFEFYKEQVQR